MGKLNLLELENEMDIIMSDYLRIIKGGNGTGDDWGNYGGYGNEANPIPLNEVVITPESNDSSFTENVLYQAFSWADATMGLSFTASESSAVFMGTTMPGWFEAASEGMAWIGVVDNVAQFIDDPNWTDATQAMVGDTLIVVAGPELMLIGTAGLFIWELVE